MKIAILGSMVFSDEMLKLKSGLEKINHEVVISSFTKGYAGKDIEEITRLTIKDKNDNNGLIELCESLKDVDAILVLNLDKKGIKNYIGGNTLIEMGYSFILGKKIFLYNPIPEIEFYKSEIVAMSPIVVNGNLSLIK
ncbi:MAG: hypothetical protein WC841_02235 [Candidatus Shapirobacteria bacterium]|jgi:hypothetical protein